MWSLLTGVCSRQVVFVTGSTAFRSEQCYETMAKKQPKYFSVT